jgi:hypothetical protein
MLNEMFTGEVAHGQGYKSIGSVAPDFAYLDGIVASMLAQSPSDRPVSIAEIKNKIELLGEQEVIRQKISKIDGAVVPTGEVDNPLAREAPRLVSAEWRDGNVILKLDRHLNAEWIEVLQYHLGNFNFLVHPSTFHFGERQAVVPTHSDFAQQVVDHFKQWLPQATAVLNARLQQQLADESAVQEAKLRQERAREAERLRTNRTLQI